MEHIVVKGCMDCPLMFWTEVSAICNYPDSPVKGTNVSKSFVNETLPKNCPLKKEPITIKLEEHG